MNPCPHCHQPLPEPDAIQVTPARVIDIADEWLTDWRHTTERIPVIYVETNGTAPPKEPLTEPKAEQP